MIRIAHVTDLHLVEPTHTRRRNAGERARLRYLNVGRQIDSAARRTQAVEALRHASLAEHVVVTGDLTEEGSLTQFEIVAEVLGEAGVRPEQVTLVPGNHDYYSSPDAFEEALRGPLQAYARTSQPGISLDLEGVTILPISTCVAQSFLRSGGLLQRADVERIAELAAREGTLLVAQHHPPIRHRNAFRHWIDGLANARAATALLEQHAHVHVLHGHLHSRRSRSIAKSRAEQVHCGAAVLESAANVRFYDAGHGAFIPLEHGAHGAGERLRPRAVVAPA